MNAFKLNPTRFGFVQTRETFDLAITSRVPNIITLDGEVFTRPVRY